MCRKADWRWSLGAFLENHVISGNAEARDDKCWRTLTKGGEAAKRINEVPRGMSKGARCQQLPFPSISVCVRDPHPGKLIDGFRGEKFLFDLLVENPA